MSCVRHQLVEMSTFCADEERENRLRIAVVNATTNAGQCCWVLLKTVKELGKK